ncbi:FAD:protein FMN transferase [Mangrovitalea sediminis]|uniref:FAD:protein FMN transferase n=1 Tax=Mangrovitalea sediminis TaxID=1982043 RepID=UPI000BE5A700|nr:FAD:protein FMN transferase [Mangrovitalea sediminis]
MSMLRALFAIAAIVLLAGCSQPPKIVGLQGHAEGTTYHIRWWSQKPVDMAQIKQQMQVALDRVDREISNYRDDSDIEHFNRNRTTDWQTLPADVIQLLDIAKTVYHDSHGCYDPTIKPLFDLWGFRADKLHVPSAAEIAATKAEVGFDHVTIDTAHSRIRKSLPQLAIDMSSMGEGYTIWHLSKVLEDAGVHNYLVEFGGDMLVKGHKPGGKRWKIAIERPLPGDMQVEKVVAILADNGVSINTSGTYRHFFDEDGHVYSHILNPRTGAPVTHNLVSATVFGTDPRVSDAWATAMLCMGRDEGGQVAQAQSLPVFFIQQEGKKLITSESPALEKSTAVMIQR